MQAWSKFEYLVPEFLVGKDTEDIERVWFFVPAQGKEGKITYCVFPSAGSEEEIEFLDLDPESLISSL